MRQANYCTLLTMLDAWFSVFFYNLVKIKTSWKWIKLKYATYPIYKERLNFYIILVKFFLFYFISFHSISFYFRLYYVFLLTQNYWNISEFIRIQSYLLKFFQFNGTSKSFSNLFQFIRNFSVFIRIYSKIF